MSSPALREHWANLERQRVAGTFGMWLFLATEILFFGGLFGAYAVYRSLYPGFIAGARETDIVFGSVNTAILLTSSLAMAIGVRLVKSSSARAAQICFAATAILGAVFLAVKGLEYREDISKHLVPGAAFALAARGAAIFWSLYWIMTLLHAVHVAVGIAAVSYIAAVARDCQWLKDSAAAEAIGLYWHFVDSVWVVLFPLLYLTGRA